MDVGTARREAVSCPQGPARWWGHGRTL